MKHRAQILLLYQAKKGTAKIAEVVGLSERTVQHWRREFLKRGMDIFPVIDEMENIVPEPEVSDATQIARSTREL